MERKIISFVILSMLFITTNKVYGKYKREYKLITAAGGDTPISKGTNKFSPIVYASFRQYLDNRKNLYYEVGLTTVTVFTKFGRHSEKYNAGIKPLWAHSVYGAYSDYYKGYSNPKNEIKGFFIGSYLFFDYNWTKIFTSRLLYGPDYHYYTAEDNANMEKPDPHWEHRAAIELLIKNIDEKNLGIIKHGFMARFRYEYSYRAGYSFQDRTMRNGETPHISDNLVTHKYYFDMGAYYNSARDFNVKLDLLSSIQFNVDRNNAEKIGYLNADHAAIPGYFYAEFYHNKYAIGKIRFGTPLPFWQARFEPGFNILYIPRNNRVSGVPDYSREYYRSISLSMTMKIANLIPLFLDYGYGIDAERRDKPVGEISKGNHEIRAFIVLAFGKYN